jgi:hypothetical protein
MCSNQDFETIANHSYGVQFDYRRVYMLFRFSVFYLTHHGTCFRVAPYPKPRYAAHPQDCSVMTYRGHSVLRTLIRCHFSPAETTGSHYLYSGSADGQIHVRSLPLSVPERSFMFHSLRRYGRLMGALFKFWTVQKRSRRHLRLQARSPSLSVAKRIRVSATSVGILRYAAITYHHPWNKF